MQTFAVLAGSGKLPEKVIKNIKAKHGDCIVVNFSNTPYPNCLTLNASLFELEKIFQFLSDNGVKKLIMIGGVDRPNFSSLKNIDKTAARYIKNLGLSIFKGDDALLKKMSELMQKDGFELLPAHQFLDQEIHYDIKTKRTPDDQQLLDIQKGAHILKHIGPLDIGQALILEFGIVLGVEGVEGTAALIKRCGGYHFHAKDQGILVKSAKPDQTLNIDRPTVGPETIQLLIQSGFSGLAIEKSSVQIVDPTLCETLADDANKFIYLF